MQSYWIWVAAVRVLSLIEFYLVEFVYVVGGDARKAIYDGYPRENVIVSDLHAGQSYYSF